MNVEFDVVFCANQQHGEAVGIGVVEAIEVEQ